MSNLGSFFISNIALVTSVFFLCASDVEAASIEYGSFDNGWYDENGRHIADNKNVVTGYLGSTSKRYNSFHVFDISFLTGPIDQAFLRFLPNNGDYRGGSGQTLNIYSVTTDIAALLTSNPEYSPAGQQIYNDLQSGNLLGSALVTGIDNQAMPEVLIELNSVALAELNHAISLGEDSFGFGASLLSPAFGEVLWAFSDGGGSSSNLRLVGDNVELPPPVPLPASLFLLLGAIFAVGSVRRFS